MGLADWFRALLRQHRGQARGDDRRPAQEHHRAAQHGLLVNDNGHGAWPLRRWAEMIRPTRKLDQFLPRQMRTALSGLMAASKHSPLSTTCMSPERAIVDDQEEEPVGPVR